MKAHQPSILRGIATGLAAGIAATVVMDQFLKLASSSHKAIEKQQKLAAGESPQQIELELAEQEQKAARQEGSTEIVARKIAKTVGKPLPEESKKTGGQAVHYTFGTLMGVVYCVSAEMVPEATAGGGSAFGTLLFLGADEIAVPALRLAPAPDTGPPMDHLEHWAAHIVYGGSLELVRSIIRRFV